MKLRFIKSPMIMMLALSITLISCLKDKAYENGQIQSIHGSETKVIGVVLTAASTTNVLSLALDNSANDTTVNLIPVTLATHDPAPQDIHVTLTPDTTLIDQYNNDNGTSLTPATNFTLLNGGVVVIPKGSNTGYLQIKFKPSDFLGTTPALAYRITSIAESGYVISGNASTGLVSINIKNQYDADYNVTGWFFHPSNGRAIDAVKHLSTISTTGLQTTVGDLGTVMQFDIINDKAVNFRLPNGDFASFDAMTLDNPGGTNYSSPTNGGHVPGDANFNSTIYNNTYDPATHTLYLHYGYNAGVVGGQSVFTRQIYEKYVLK